MPFNSETGAFEPAELVNIVEDSFIKEKTIKEMHKMVDQAEKNLEITKLLGEFFYQPIEFTKIDGDKEKGFTEKTVKLNNKEEIRGLLVQYKDKPFHEIDRQGNGTHHIMLYASGMGVDYEMAYKALKNPTAEESRDVLAKLEEARKQLFKDATCDNKELMLENISNTYVAWLKQREAQVSELLYSKDMSKLEVIEKYTFDNVAFNSIGNQTLNFLQPDKCKDQADIIAKVNEKLAKDKLGDFKSIADGAMIFNTFSQLCDKRYEKVILKGGVNDAIYEDMELVAEYGDAMIRKANALEEIDNIIAKLGGDKNWSVKREGIDLEKPVLVSYEFLTEDYDDLIKEEYNVRYEKYVTGAYNNNKREIDGAALIVSNEVNFLDEALADANKYNSGLLKLRGSKAFDNMHNTAKRIAGLLERKNNNEDVDKQLKVAYRDLLKQSQIYLSKKGEVDSLENSNAGNRKRIAEYFEKIANAGVLKGSARLTAAQQALKDDDAISFSALRVDIAERKKDLLTRGFTVEKYSRWRTEMEVLHKEVKRPNAQRKAAYVRRDIFESANKLEDSKAMKLLECFEGEKLSITFLNLAYRLTSKVAEENNTLKGYNYESRRALKNSADMKDSVFDKKIKDAIDLVKMEAKDSKVSEAKLNEFLDNIKEARKDLITNDEMGRFLTENVQEDPNFANFGRGNKEADEESDRRINRELEEEHRMMRKHYKKNNV